MPARGTGCRCRPGSSSPGTAARRLFRAGFEPHEGVGESCFRSGCTAAESSTPRACPAADPLRGSSFWCMWCGMGPRLSKNLQSRFQPFSAPSVRAEEESPADLDRFLEQESLAAGQAHVAQPFVRRRPGAVSALVVDENQRSLMPPRCAPKRNSRPDAAAGDGLES